MKIFANKKLLLAVIFAAALLVRLGVMVTLETYKFPDEESFGFGYGDTARYVALGEGFKATHFQDRPPGYTAVSPPAYVYAMALVFSIFGIYSISSAIVLEVLQSLAGALICLVFYQLGKRFDERAGVLAALGAAFYPPAIAFSVLRISPILIVVLLLGIIMLYLFKIQERGRMRDVVVCGALMGVTALVEPTPILFYAAACVWLLCWSPTPRAALAQSLVMASICILFVLPWTIRNYVVFGAFVPIKSTMGTHLLHGNNPYSQSGGVTFGPETRQVFSDEERAMLRKMDEVEENRFRQRKAVEFITADPGAFFKRTLDRIYYYWALTNPHRPTPYDRLRAVTYGPIFVLGLAGLFFLRRGWKDRSLFLALLAAYPLFYYVTQVTINRYRLVPEVFLILPAAFAMADLMGRLGIMRLPAAGVAAGVKRTEEVEA